MKNLLYIGVLLLLFTSGKSYSQFSIGVKSGYTFSQFTYTHSVEDYNQRLKSGSLRGVYMKKRLLPGFDLQAGLVHTHKGARLRNNELNSILIAHVEYAQVPIGLRINIPVLPVYLFAGIYTAYCFEGYLEETFQDSIVKSPMNFKDDEYRRFDFGYSLALGYIKSLSPFNLFAEIRYEPGLVHVNKSNSVDVGGNNAAVLFSAGIQLDF